MRLAAIDLGTNSIHMIVVDASARRFEVIDREKIMVKLGQDLFGEMRLTERAMNAGLDALRRFSKLAENRGVERILAVATAAVREADNGTEFLDAVFRETGLTPRVISGNEEARLIFLAARHALDLGTERALVIDIGGGSVEIALGSHEEVLLCQSLRLGVQRLLARQGTPGALGPRQAQELSAYVESVAENVLKDARKIGFERVIGTSGTIRTLGEAAHLAAGGTPSRSVNARVVPRRDLAELTRKLCSLEPKERVHVDGIGEARADAIHLGGVLLVQLLNMAGANELTLSDASLREGVIIDYLERHGTRGGSFALILDPRRRSVVELARKYERDDPRERHIARIALQLFDGTESVHGFGAFERQLLEYAALLHGIGQHVSFHNRHKHTRYIIRQSALRGFTDEEIDLLSSVAFYHRKKKPKARHGRLAHLSPQNLERVCVLSAILRLAVALDRGHSQQVRSLECQVTPEQIRIEVSGNGELELELFAAKKELEALSIALRRPVDIARDPKTAIQRESTVGQADERREI